MDFNLVFELNLFLKILSTGFKIRLIFKKYRQIEACLTRSSLETKFSLHDHELSCAQIDAIIKYVNAIFLLFEQFEHVAQVFFCDTLTPSRSFSCLKVWFDLHLLVVLKTLDALQLLLSILELQT